jgi:hypothetical protein
VGIDKRTRRRIAGHGVVHGRTIEVEEDLGVAEGRRVELQVRIVAHRAAWGDGSHRSAGGWANCPETNSIMKTIQRGRKRKRRPRSPAIHLVFPRRCYRAAP